MGGLLGCFLDFLATAFNVFTHARDGVASRQVQGKGGGDGNKQEAHDETFRKNGCVQCSAKKQAKVPAIAAMLDAFLFDGSADASADAFAPIGDFDA